MTKCRAFVLAVEDYLAQHPASQPQLPSRLEAHARDCARCRRGWETARQGRQLLAAIRVEGERPTEPFFLTRVQARIAQEEQRRAQAAGFLGRPVRWRDVAIAGAFFAATLCTFVYDVHRTEAPNADEAIALDVPHLNPNHPAGSHVRPKLADAMLNLMNP
jgi:hypothetical protein